MKKLSIIIIITIFSFFSITISASGEAVVSLNTQSYEIEIVADYYAWDGKLNDNNQVIINNHDAIRLWEEGVEVSALTGNANVKVYGINNNGLMVGKRSINGQWEAVIWGYDFTNPITCLLYTSPSPRDRS